jgi:hypothetical protein
MCTLLCCWSFKTWYHYKVKLIICNNQADELQCKKDLCVLNYSACYKSSNSMAATVSRCIMTPCSNYSERLVCTGAGCIRFLKVRLACRVLHACALPFMPAYENSPSQLKLVIMNNMDATVR